MNIDLIYAGGEKLGPIPLGIITLSAFIKNKGYKARVLNFDGVFDLDKKLKHMYIGYSPDLVGITTFTSPTLKRVITIIQFIRNKFPETKIVLGGVHASIFAEEIIKELPIDFVVIGEGEETFQELLEVLNSHEDLSSVNGIVYKENNNVIRTANRAPISDLNLLPRPEWDKVDIAEQYYLYLIESRGCPFNCSFCYNIIHRSYRTKSVDKIVEDFRYLFERYRIGTIKLWDDLPLGGDKRKMIDFCNRLIKEKIRIKWSTYARTETIDYEVLDAMTKAGCFRIGMGVESGSPRMLVKLNKKTTPEAYKQAYDLLNKFDIISVASFMIGLPDETEKDLQQTIELARELRGVEYYPFNFKPYPGTELYKECLKRGFHPPQNTLEWSYFANFYDFKFNVSNLSTERLKEAAKKILSFQNKQKRMRILFQVGLYAFALNPIQETKKIIKVGYNRAKLRLHELV